MNSFIRGSYDVHVACYEMLRAMEKILNNVIIEKYRLCAFSLIDSIFLTFQLLLQQMFGRNQGSYLLQTLALR